MEERINEELALLRCSYPALEHVTDGHWVCIPGYPLPPGWGKAVTDVAFQIPASYPGVPPYGIYVPEGLTFNGTKPNNYTEPASNQPPFGGTWAVFSWQPGEKEWRPSSSVRSGTNLLTWVRGFAVRFQEGV